MTSSVDDPVTLIGLLFGLDEDRAARVFMHCLWADEQRALAIYGYTKDNAIPEPLDERLRDRAYIDSLLDAERDEDDPDGVILDALARFANKR